MNVKSSIRNISVSIFLVLLAVWVAACSSGQSAPAEADAAPTSPPAAEAVAAPPVQAAPAAEPDRSGARTFQIVQDGTEARFYIDEVLMGNDVTVVGVTSLVQGELVVDPANPARTELSPIRIDARDLSTDSDRRNGAIRRFILQSNQDQYQYITFEPTAVEEMPASVNVGDSFTFSVTGNLTIRDVTNVETFEVSVTVNSAEELVGLGQTTIQRANYNLTIPSVPSVANVAEEVPLEIEFTARAVE